MRVFAENIKRPFMVRYNPYTQSVEVLSNAKKITAVVSELKGDLSILSSALKKVSALDENLDVEYITGLLQSGLQVSNFFYNFMKKKNVFLFSFINDTQVNDKSPSGSDRSA